MVILFIVEFLDVTSNLLESDKKRYRDSNFSLLEVKFDELNKNTFVDLLEKMLQEDLNYKEILLGGNHLYFKPNSWGHKRCNFKFKTEGWKSCEPATISDFSRKSYFPFYVEEELMDKNHLISTSFQSSLIRDSKLQVTSNEGVLIRNPVFLFDDVIKSRDGFPILVEYQKFMTLPSTYIPDVCLPLKYN